MKRLIVFIFSGFLATFHVTLAIYILSSFIETFTGEKLAGLLYTGTAVLTLIALLNIPRIMERFSPVRVALSIIVLEFIALSILALFGTSSPLSFIGLLLYMILPPLLWYSMDLILTGLIKHPHNTGQIRTTYLSISVIAAIISQPLMGMLLGDTLQYQTVFFVGALTLIPAGILLFISVLNHSHNHPTPSPFPLKDSLLCLLGDRNTWRMFSVGFLLQICYAWLTIYPPLYFHKELGIDWIYLAPVFAIMLIPYAVIEPIIGFLEDRKFGEREFMAIGFLILGVAMMAISFIIEPLVTPLLVSVMLMTRVGASFIEASTESYFFKHISSDDTNTLSLYRSLSPFSLIIGPLIGSLLLFSLPFIYIFIVFGVILLVGIPIALSLTPIRKPIHDTIL